MRSALQQQQTVSDDTLSGEFPFFKRREHDNALPLSTQESFNYGNPQTSHQQSPGKAPRRFPSEIFEDLTKREIQSVVEILHSSAEATTGDDVSRVLQLIQRAVACPCVSPTERASSMNSSCFRELAVAYDCFQVCVLKVERRDCSTGSTVSYSFLQ